VPNRTSSQPPSANRRQTHLARHAQWQSLDSDRWRQLHANHVFCVPATHSALRDELHVIALVKQLKVVFTLDVA
jgi:hypothetical protein